jgi:hypothetical protein
MTRSPEHEDDSVGILHEYPLRCRQRMQVEEAIKLLRGHMHENVIPSL